MNLTREQAIEEHRKMWNWIADEIENSKKCSGIIYLKIEYCVKNECENIRNHCFACEYSNLDCKKCPVDWESKVEDIMCIDKNYHDDDKGYYSLLFDADNWQKQAEIARKIANLPERTDV